MEAQEFVKTINSLRLANKNRWYYWNGTVNGKEVRVKAYNTYLQIFNVDDMHISSGMGMSITEYKAKLAEGVE